MPFRVSALAAVFACSAALAHAQAPLTLQIAGGRVTLHAENVPARTILAEWSRLGGTKIVNGDRVVGSPLTLELEGVPERQALEIILRGVSGYALGARVANGAGASMYDRIMILPTSVAPRAPAPAAAPAFPGPGGIVRPIPRQADADDDGIAPPVTVSDGVPLGRPVPVARPGFNGMPIAAPPIPIAPDTDPQPQQPAGVVVTPTNPFGLPAGSSVRPGVITPVAPQQVPQGGAPRPQD